jgi:hypothetical protein
MAYNMIAVSLGRASNRAGSTISELAKRLSRTPGETFARSNPEALRTGTAS